MIFDDRLIQAGEAGGKEAASMLWTAVRDYVHQQKFGLPSDFKIVTRIYANLKGLGDVCHRAGILDGSTVIEDFARGFTGSKQFFDFVDVGTGKDRADDKISGRQPDDPHNIGQHKLMASRTLQTSSLQLSLSTYNLRLFS